MFVILKLYYYNTTVTMLNFLFDVIGNGNSCSNVLVQRRHYGLGWLWLWRPMLSCFKCKKAMMPLAGMVTYLYMYTQARHTCLPPLTINI